MPTPSEINRTTYGAVLGRVLADLRSNSGLEQSELAAQLGMSQPSWSRIERGETAATAELLVRVAETLRLSPQEILERAERARKGLEQMGVSVLLERPGKNTDAMLALLGGAALGFLIMRALSK